MQPRARASILLALGVLLVPAASARADEPIRIRGMTFVTGEPSGQRVVVLAARAAIDPGAEVAELEDVTVHFEQTGAATALELRCASASVALGGESFRLEGDVSGTDQDGRRFATTWLEFDGASRTLHTDAPVSLIDGGAEYRGVGFSYEVETRRLRLLGGVRVETGHVE